ncbi:GTP cyclohydrolase [Burkholderia phage BcepGomr]|uniref:GTP cyclohydrolase n=1 Tax=Burkholderia phage BcepGomr TaxID=437329 RepID=UPI00015034F2|nr:GTP cyclohydrolase [Burkholderia phage BcepGomr]ABP63604.1 BcepGomrgp33 [Burkholderia phage BcepGomr]
MNDQAEIFDANDKPVVDVAPANMGFPALLDGGMKAKLVIDPAGESKAKWERMEDIVRAFLTEIVGEDIDREGLRETPKRVVKAWLSSWAAGYMHDPAEVLKVFEDGAEGSDDWIIVRDIPIYSHCEHHMAAIMGTAHIGYIPSGKVVGISKLKRLADIFAKRLQVQERLTNQIADALAQHVQPRAVYVTINARHMCMESRGVNTPGSSTVTSAARFPTGTSDKEVQRQLDRFYQKLSGF